MLYLCRKAWLRLSKVEPDQPVQPTCGCIASNTRYNRNSKPWLTKVNMK